MEDDEAAWAGTLLPGHPTKTPGAPSYRAGKNQACTPPVSPTGQARMHGPLSSRASKTLSQDFPRPLCGPVGYSPPGQARMHTPLSSRASKNARTPLSSRAGKTIFKTSKSLLLPGKQGRSGHPLPGQARPPAPSSYRATKSPASGFSPSPLASSPTGQARHTGHVGTGQPSTPVGKETPARAAARHEMPRLPAASALPRLACPGRDVGTPSARKIRPRPAGS